MITYNWKAEFGESELATIKWWKRQRVIDRANGNTGELAIVITEMANSLNRYETFLNEMEKEHKR